VTGAGVGRYWGMGRALAAGTAPAAGPADVGRHETRVSSEKGCDDMPESEIDGYFVSRPAYEVIPAFEVKGRLPAMTMMSNNLVPGSDHYVEVGWITQMPDINPHILEHTHDYDEIVMHIGTDPSDEEDLGAEIEFMLDGRPLIIDKTSSVFVPRGMKHGPLTWKRFTKPHLEMTIMVGAGSIKEADPGGHREKLGTGGAETEGVQTEG